jgi:hypothetical protein
MDLEKGSRYFSNALAKRSRASRISVAGCSGYRGENKGKDWVEKTLGWSGESSSSAHARACLKGSAYGVGLKQWSEEGVRVDWEKLLPPKGFQVLPRRWVVERTFSWTQTKTVG